MGGKERKTYSKEKMFHGTLRVAACQEEFSWRRIKCKRGFLNKPTKEQQERRKVLRKRGKRKGMQKVDFGLGTMVNMHDGTQKAPR